MPQVIRAEYLITDPTLMAKGVIRDGALVIDGPCIIAAGPWAQLRAESEQLPCLGGPDDWLVMPGLVNAHHHGRGISTLGVGMPDAPLEFWSPALMLYRGIDVYANTIYAAARMLLCGITTSVHSHFCAGPLAYYRENVGACLTAYRDAGVRITFAMGISDQQYFAYIPDEEFMASIPESLRKEVRSRFDPADLYISIDDYFSLYEEYSRRCRSEYPLTKLIFGPRGFQWSSEELLQRLALARQRYQTGIHIHLLETFYQMAYSRRRFKASPVKIMDRHGLLGPSTTIAHAIWVADSDLDCLARSGTTVVANTSSNLRLGSGILPLNAIRERCIKVAIGLDSNSLFDDDDIFKEMRIVGTLHRRPGLDAAWASPYEILSMATVGGARAALLDGQVGRLLPGYRADVTVLNLRRIRTPYVDPHADIPGLALSRADASDVDTVLVEGKVLVSGGKCTQLDVHDIESRLASSCQAQERVRDDAAHAFLANLRPYLHAVYRGW